MNNIIELIRKADPADMNSVVKVSDPRAHALLERVQLDRVQLDRVTTRPGAIRRKFVVASSIVAVAAMYGILKAPFGSAPSANAAVRAAIGRSIGASSGRAVVHLDVTPGPPPSSDVLGVNPASISKSVTGVIKVAWSGSNESYDHDFSDMGKWSIRVIDGVTYLRSGGQPWVQANAEEAYQSGLSGSADQFEVLNTKLSFRDDGTETIDNVRYRHVVAISRRSTPRLVVPDFFLVPTALRAQRQNRLNCGSMTPTGYVEYSRRSATANVTLSEQPI
jgi:hypothetical protein